MVTPKAKVDFTLNDKNYFVGDEVKENYESIVKLNEKGYIEPLSLKELIEYKNNEEE